MKKFAAYGLVAALAFAPVASFAQTDTPSPAATDTMMKKPMKKMTMKKPMKKKMMKKKMMATPTETPTT